MSRLQVGEMVNSDQEIARMRNKTFVISSSIQERQRLAVSRFLNDEISLDELLGALGFDRSNLLQARRKGIDKIPKQLGRRRALLLQSSNSKEFPEEIRKTLRSLECPQIYLYMPKGSKIASDSEIVESLFAEFADSPYELGKLLGKHFKGRHDLNNHFLEVISLLEVKNNLDKSLASKDVARFALGFFEGLSRAPRDLSIYLYDYLEPLDIIDLSNNLSAIKNQFGHNRFTLFEKPDKVTFLCISRRIIDEDFERHSDPSLPFDFHGPYLPEWDNWISSRLTDFITGGERSNSRESIFSFDEYVQLRDAFSPYRFPRAASQLVHVGFNWSELKLENLTLEVLKNLENDLDRNSPAHTFLEAVLADKDVLRTKPAQHLLESLTTILESRIATEPDRLFSSVMIDWELQFIAAIASENSLALPYHIEVSLIGNDKACETYIKGAKPSAAFISEMIRTNEIKPIIALLERFIQLDDSIEIERKDLDHIFDHFDELTSIALARGLRNAPSSIASEHFQDASRFSSLVSFLRDQTLGNNGLQFPLIGR